ncbi:asparagine synthase (glutamine-hydrolyzing) [Hahella sp. SMD15-11]|uniref:asparagine synthase (glutamine-hydrolyzing) n=1 Tax=Thermohahella caldifontis TaxID=3142973 RepID=A0AB39UXE6_9GAMM
MCGLAGIIDRNLDEVRAAQVTAAMGQALIHRGPDGEGSAFYPEAGLAWVHRRLAIQDLSEAGAQPMTSASGRYSLVFNGEIYNFRTLRAELEAKGHAFRGHSDTEVLLAGIESWGLEATLQRACGMFAIALYDRHARTLTLARDRMGEKPLYYGSGQGRLFFASELKALRVIPGFLPAINRDALTLLLRHNFIPAPHTIYEGVFKLLPGHWIELSLGEMSEWPAPRKYWSLDAQFAASPMAGSPESAVSALEQLLMEVVDEHCVADVPLGAFLSGGVDSSTVAAIMKAVRGQNVHTYSIGFQEKGFDESVYAREVARHLGTEHTELQVTADDALQVVTQLPEIYDEPFADSSQIPTVLLSRLTRQHVTVALSGDGGDELFCGYPRYGHAVTAWQQRHSPKAQLKGWIGSLPPAWVRSVLALVKPAYRDLSDFDVAEKLRAVRNSASARRITDLYRAQVSYWQQPESVVKGGREPDYALTATAPDHLDDFKSLMRADLEWYLPDDILVKVDRAGMSASLETRVPLLDPRIVAFALSLPVEWNRQDTQGKSILRNVLYRHVPRALIDRPKQGFAIPKAEWLRGPLRSWAEDLLDPGRLEAEGFWKVDPIRSRWEAHCRDIYDFSFQLWGVLMFQTWLDAHD